MPHGGVGLFGNGFLPASHQASLLNAGRGRAAAQRHPARAGRRASAAGSTSSTPRTPASSAPRNRTRRWRRRSATTRPPTACRPPCPELCDLSGEIGGDEAALRGGFDTDANKAAYARQCLLARRLVERGVRFVELSCLTTNIGAGNGPIRGTSTASSRTATGRWPTRWTSRSPRLIQDLKRARAAGQNAGRLGRRVRPHPVLPGKRRARPQPLRLQRLARRRRHRRAARPTAATDELGYYAVDSPCTVYDLWATVLHQLGLDHERLTYRYGGRDFRLTDVHGSVLRPILA